MGCAVSMFWSSLSSGSGTSADAKGFGVAAVVLDHGARRGHGMFDCELCTNLNNRLIDVRSQVQHDDVLERG